MIAVPPELLYYTATLSGSFKPFAMVTGRPETPTTGKIRVQSSALVRDSLTASLPTYTNRRLSESLHDALNTFHAFDGLNF